MVKFEWDASIELGIPAIDKQHQALFEWVNTLNEAVQRGDGSEAVNEVIWNLITYVTEHFTAEEQLMMSCDYPRLIAHRKEHDQFVDRLRHIQVEFIDGHQMSETILDFLVDWLICHIKGTDQNYSRFMQKQNLAI